METRIKKILIIFIVTVLFIAIFISSCSISGNKKIIKFENNNFSSFTLSDFGEYENIYCQEANTGFFLFPEKTCLVIVDYEDNCFVNQLNVIENDISFLNEVIMYDDGKSYIIPDFDFSINEWSFRIIKGENYPYNIDLIGVNTEQNKIAYLSYIDTDRDFLCSEEDNKNNDYMQRFVKKKFKYNFA